MRIAVVSSLQASSQFAHAINTVKMAQGFARLGHEVTMICTHPLSGRVPEAKLAQLYGLTTPLQWQQLPSHRLTGHYWLFGFLSWRAIRALQPHFVYTRTYVTPWLTSRQGIPTAGETHAHIGNRKLPFRLFLRATRFEAFRLLVTISARLAAHYQERGVPAGKTAVLPTGVDIEMFQRPAQLPPSPLVTAPPNVLYSGHLYDYNGIPTILQVARLLPTFNFHLVGGWPEDIQRHQTTAQELGVRNVHFYGLQPHAAVPPYLWHADLLLQTSSLNYPNAAWASPVKLGEYLVSGTPVIATTVPALLDLLTDQEVAFIPPDDPQALAQAIQQLWTDQACRQALAQSGRQKGLSLSYTERARKILQHAGLEA